MLGCGEVRGVGADRGPGDGLTTSGGDEMERDVLNRRRMKNNGGDKGDKEKTRTDTIEGGSHWILKATRMASFVNTHAPLPSEERPVRQSNPCCMTRMAWVQAPRRDPTQSIE